MDCVYLKAPIPVSGPSSSVFPSPLKEALASFTAFSMKSSLIFRDGCSLKTEFMRAILAELLLASAFVGQLWEGKKIFVKELILLFNSKVVIFQTF